MIARSSNWQLQEAKNKLSEVIRRAREEGPQTITVRGEEAAVVMSRERYHELVSEPRAAGSPNRGKSLYEFAMAWADRMEGIEFELAPRQVEPPRPNPFEDESQE